MLFITPHPPLIRIYNQTMTNEQIEIIGYLASAITVISFLMKNVIQLRIVNLTACLMFIFYGVMIGSWPVVIVNSVVAAVNIYFILKYKIQNKAPLKVTALNKERKA